MLLTIIVFLIVLSLLIFVHELGHFLVARRAGIGVEEFGFGLPPRILGIKRGETIYSLNWLPIGGFVRLAGEDEEPHFAKASRGKERQFWAKSKKARAAVIFAGVLMNFFLAVGVFGVIYTKMGIPTKTDQVKIVGVAPSSPAAQVGVKPDDMVVSVGGEKITDTKTFMEITQKLAGQEMRLEITRRSENLVFVLVPRAAPPAGEGPLGVAISQIEIKFYPAWQMPARGAVEGLKEAFAWTGLIVGSLGLMIWQLLTAGAVPKDVAGPVGIFQITGHVAQSGTFAVLQFLGILSVNLAVINILPIPALDGGRLLFILIEAVTGRRVKAGIERWTHQIGMIILLFLILLITYNDILRILTTTDFGSRLRQILPLKF